MVLIGSGVVMERDCIGGGAANAVGPSIRHVIKRQTLNVIVAVHYDLRVGPDSKFAGARHDESFFAAIDRFFRSLEDKTLVFFRQ